MGHVREAETPLPELDDVGSLSEDESNSEVEDEEQADPPSPLSEPVGHSNEDVDAAFGPIRIDHYPPYMDSYYPDSIFPIPNMYLQVDGDSENLCEYDHD